MQATGVSVKLAALRYQGEWGLKASEKRYAGFGGICFYDIIYWLLNDKDNHQEKINVIHAHTYGVANRAAGGSCWHSPARKFTFSEGAGKDELGRAGFQRITTSASSSTPTMSWC
jgi:hypothetical protein